MDESFPGWGTPAHSLWQRCSPLFHNWAPVWSSARGRDSAGPLVPARSSGVSREMPRSLLSQLCPAPTDGARNEFLGSVSPSSCVNK